MPASYLVLPVGESFVARAGRPEDVTIMLRRLCVVRYSYHTFCREACYRSSFLGVRRLSSSEDAAETAVSSCETLLLTKLQLASDASATAFTYISATASQARFHRHTLLSPLSLMIVSRVQTPTPHPLQFTLCDGVPYQSSLLLSCLQLQSGSYQQLSTHPSQDGSLSLPPDYVGTTSKG